jgi:hypothetical protein
MLKAPIFDRCCKSLGRTRLGVLTFWVPEISLSMELIELRNLNDTVDVLELYRSVF